MDYMHEFLDVMKQRLGEKCLQTMTLTLHPAAYAKLWHDSESELRLRFLVTDRPMPEEMTYIHRNTRVKILRGEAT